MTQAATSVYAAIVVSASLERAFAVFTSDLASWWPADHHVLDAPLDAMVFEARVGGRVFDRHVDGREFDWGRVLAYQPPQRVVFSWDISPRWTPEPDPNRCSEVEVNFIAEAPRRTRVELIHRNLDRHGDGWEHLRERVGSPGGWTPVLRDFAAACLTDAACSTDTDNS